MEKSNQPSDRIELTCPLCHAIFPRSQKKQERFPIIFCAYCGTRLQQGSDLPPSMEQASYIQEHRPSLKDPPIAHMGRYIIVQLIGKGGMGEVFLAYDTISGRQVALKKIRSDLVSSQTLRERFIREARITSQLMHPSIIPIYDIHIESHLIYYTMPYVHGQTLRALLKELKNSEETDFFSDRIVTPYHSLQSLMRVFLGIAQAIAFAHSRGILHRDIKPENIIIGHYGQVTILDWGLTKVLEDSEVEEKDIDETHPSKRLNHLTKIGKFVGTLAYMAPERACHGPSSPQTDIYALGVILYQILTLALPFQRKSIKEFQEKWGKEKYIPPEIRAPHRDIPQSLSEIVKKCLSKEPSHRFQTADELVQHIEGYLEGRSEWREGSVLSLLTRQDWSYQEHVLLTEHSAISTPIDRAEWFRIFISQARFHDNVQLSATVTLKKSHLGVGFLVGIPEENMRRHLLDGYCVWLSSTEALSSSPSKILRHGISILELSDVALEPEKSYLVRIDRIDHTISVWIDHECVATKTGFLPVVGEHVGVLIKDTSYPMNTLSVASGSINILINRLAVPDAFLSQNNFDQALYEYRKIASLFPGHYEGREAVFRSGICLLEKAKRSSSFNIGLYDDALDEFEKLRATPGAPLEYLGKSLVYHDLADYDEEIKCFELLFMRFPKHPLLRLVSETLLERMYEMAKIDRKAAYAFISLVLRRLPQQAIEKRMSKMLLDAVERSWEIPPFFKPHQEKSFFCLVLGFWLQKGYIGHEVFQELIELPILPKELLYNSCVVSLFSSPQWFQKSLTQWASQLSDDEREEFSQLFQLFELLLNEDTIRSLQALPQALNSLSDREMTLLLMDRFNALERYDLTVRLYEATSIAPQDLEYVFEALFALKRQHEARTLFATIPQELYLLETSRLFFWYGVLFASEGQSDEMWAHFSFLLSTPTPKSWLLGAYVMTNTLHINASTTGWLKRSFPYERQVLLRQIHAIQPYLSEDISHAKRELMT